MASARRARVETHRVVPHPPTTTDARDRRPPHARPTPDARSALGPRAHMAAVTQLLQPGATWADFAADTVRNWCIFSEAEELRMMGEGRARGADLLWHCFTPNLEDLTRSPPLFTAMATCGLCWLLYFLSDIVSERFVAQCRIMRYGYDPYAAAPADRAASDVPNGQLGKQGVYCFRWNAGVVRGIMGFVLFFLATKFLLSGKLLDNVVFGFDPWASFVVHFACGFFFYELSTMYPLYIIYGESELPLLAHHIFGIMMYTTQITSRTFYTWGVLSMIEELSAGFTSMGQMLSRCGLGTSPAWFANQVRAHMCGGRIVAAGWLMHAASRSRCWPSGCLSA